MNNNKLKMFWPPSKFLFTRHSKAMEKFDINRVKIFKQLKDANDSEDPLFNLSCIRGKKKF